MINDRKSWESTGGQFRWPHFSFDELKCKGTGSLIVDPRLLDKLESLRILCGFPLHITSGYRSPEYNKKVSSTGENGPHTTGLAVDIAVSGAPAWTLVSFATHLGFKGIGVQQKGPFPSRFIHLDLLAAPQYPRPALWSY